MGFLIKKLIYMRIFIEECKFFLVDKRIIKIWDEYSGDFWILIELMVDFNDVVYVLDFGMFLMVNEGKYMYSFFILNFGFVFKWCMFFDNFVYEMENEI